MDEPAEISLNYHANDNTMDSDEEEHRHPTLQNSLQATDEATGRRMIYIQLRRKRLEIMNKIYKTN